MARWVLLSALGMGAGLLAAEPQAGHPVGHEKFTATPERPVGWLGDWHGRFSGAHDFPLEWAAPREWTDPPEAGSNILWKTALPGWGHSSPVHVNGRIFLTCEPDITVGLDAETGKVLWKHSAGAKHTGSSGTYHYSTGWTMGTVCSDGKSVFVNHFNGIVIAYDLDGNVRWRKEVAPLGWCAASPVLVDNMLVVIHNELKKGESPATQKPNIRGPYEIAAYRPEDGAPVWKNAGSLLMNGWHYNGLTPVRVGDRLFLVSYCGQVYDGRDGKLLMQLLHHGGWGCQWLAAAEGDTVVFCYETGDPMTWRQKMIDLKLGGVPEPAGMERVAGWIEADRKLQSKRPPLYHVVVAVRLSLDSGGKLNVAVRGRPTLLPRGGGYNHLLVDRDFVYFVQDGPRIRVIDLKTNEPVGAGGYEGWAPEAGQDGGGWFFSHAIMADDYLVVSHWGGLTRVFRRAPDFALLASNQTRWAGTRKSAGVIGSPMDSVESSPFVVGDRLFCRHWDALYCVWDRNRPAQEEAFAGARKLAEDGKTAQALEAYDALWRSDALHVRYRALQEMSRVLGAQAAASLCKALRHKDPALRTLAVSLGAGIAGEAASSKFAGELADPDPDYRQQVLAVLGRRGDRSVSESLAKAMDDANSRVRAAAISAARTVGGPVLVNAVVSRYARFDAAERLMALDTMVAMPEPETEACMAGSVTGAPAVARAALLRALGRRNASSRVTLFLEEAANPAKEVRLAAFEALGAVAATNHLDAVIHRLKKSGDDEERLAAESALLSIMSRTQCHAAYSEALLKGLEGAGGGTAVSIIRGLGYGGGPRALAKVREFLKGPEPTFRTAAVQALSRWPGTEVEADLMGVARDSKTDDDRRFAARGLMRMVDLSPDRPAKDVVAVYARALATGQETETILRRLGEVGDVQAINLAASCLNKSELEATIVESITRIGPVAAEKDPSATVAALQKAQEEVRDAGRRNAIDSVVQALIAKHGDKAVPVPSAGGDKDLGLDL